MKNTVSKMIFANEELLKVNGGYSNAPTEWNNEQRFWKSGWIDLVRRYMTKRNIKLLNTICYYDEITQNMTIIDYALIYVQ